MSILPLKNTHQPFNWVKPELDKSVSYIRAALETYGHDLHNIEPLLPIVEQLHLLRGSLYILELYGASLLVEDMEKTVRAILSKTIDRTEDAFEALVKATISLEGYLEKLAKDPADIPVILLPIINDLRASRNEPLLTESNLFNPNLSIVPKFPDQVDLQNDLAPQLAETAKSLRPYFQAALLTWYRNPKDVLSLQQMKLVLRNLESSSYTPRMRQLWWISGGLAEALADNGVHSNVSIRLLLGQIDRAIKTVAQQDSKTIEKNPPVDLLKNVLFYVAHSASRGERVTTLKRAYQLDSLIPSEADLRNLRENIRNPKSESFNVIANELNKTIQKIKVIIDAYVRGNSKDAGQVKDVLLPLKHIADTLSLISLGKERQLLLKQIEHFNDIIGQRRVPNRDELLSLASAIVHIESVINNIGNERRISDRPIDQLNEKRRARQMVGTMDNNAQANMLNRLPETEYRILVQKAAEEARNNVLTIKNNILAFLTSPLKQKLVSDVPRLLNDIRGCLIMIDHQYAASLVKALGEYTQKNLIEQDIQPQKSELDEFAEAIVGLEFYLESIAEGRAQLESILEITRESLIKIGYKVAPPKHVDAKTIPILENIVTNIQEASKQKAAKAGSKASPEIKEAKIISVEIEDEIDPEVKEIFIEETIGELENMEKSLSALKLATDDKNALANLRRVYHTLKGSGRIAGANPISEFATVFEEFVNRMTVGALALDMSNLKLLIEAQPVLKKLIECYRKNSAPPVNVNRLVHDVINIMEDRVVESTVDHTNLFAEPAEKEASGVTYLGDIQTKIEPINPKSESTERATAQLPEPEETDAQAGLTVIQEEENNRLAVIEGAEDPVHDALRAIESVENFIASRKKTRDESPLPGEILLSVENLYKTAFKIPIREFAQTTELLLRYVRNIVNYHTVVQNETLDILAEFCATSREMLKHHAVPVKTIAKQSEPQPVAPTTADKSGLELVPMTPTPSQDANIEEQDLTLIDIFFDEARDLVAQGNSNLEQWKNKRPDTDLLESLQRILHTLKGSARMAGITIIGNIGHNMESVLDKIVTGEIDRDLALNELMQKSFDAVTDVIENLNRGNEIQNFETLFNEIENYIEAHQTKSNVVETEPDEAAVIEESIESTIATEATESTERNTQPTVLSLQPITPVPEPIQSERVDAAMPPTTTPPTIAQPENTNFEKQPKGEPVKIDIRTLDSLVNAANEENITQHRIDDHVTSIKASLLELDRTISRLRIQVRDVEFDNNSPKTELNKALDIAKVSGRQESAQRLLESIGDLENLHGTLTRLTLETDNYLHQQRKVHNELYEGLLGARMISFSNQSQRLQKIVRQTARELGKKVNLELIGADGSLDRSLLDHLMGPIEHILRNAIAHGIESPEQRIASHKAESGTVTLSFSKEGSDYVVRIDDDGNGIDIDAIRNKATRVGLLKGTEDISDDDLIQLIFEPGFSTSDVVSQIAGRGIGMDVVNTEIQKLGGTVYIETAKGKGTSFTIKVPYTVSLNRTLLVRCGDSLYAIASTSVEGVQPLTRSELKQQYEESRPKLSIDNDNFPLWYLDTLLNANPIVLPDATNAAPVVLLRNNRTKAAIHVDEIIETRDSVLKPTGPQLAKIKGVTGATVLDEGQIALILDVPALLRMAVLNERKESNVLASTEQTQNARAPTILVVDDSITVRKVTERFLRRNGYSVSTAKDGVEALEQLDKQKTDLILLDIEMPRMDGLEVTRRIRSKSSLAGIPIIMITSRTGKTHRDAAETAGVNVFMAKPYQELKLLEQIKRFLSKGSEAPHSR